MPEPILVVEREARDAELVRQALAGQPFSPSYVREGEEALRALDTTQPKLIVLPSDDLVGLVRERPALRKTPVLVVRQPFSQGAFLGEVKKLLAAGAPGHLTSNDIFGDIFEDDRARQAGARKPMNPSDDLDKLLADTLSDVMPKAKPRTQPGTTGLDKKLQDTLSGLEKTVRAKTSSGSVRVPVPPPEPAGEKTHIAAPVFPPPPPAPVDEEPVDGIRFGQYVLLEKIASGGMAEVWKARMRGVEGFQKIVAIKRILPHLSDNQEFIDMFIDEAKLAAQLNHANIIHIYDLGKIQNSYYIAMEYVEGSDLKTILKQGEERDQPLTVELALFITSKVAAALDYAHRKEMGLVHRDVSPQNVLISEEGDIKLCDFGIAKAASKASHTQAGALKGKLQYMSPEQAWGKPLDRRSDIFALAAVLFEMLTRRKLFSGDNEMSILEQVREARVTAPSEFNDEVTPDIDAIVLKALRQEPANRYQTAAEFAKDIDSLLYTYRPTPNAADLAIYMHRLKNAQPVIAPPPLIEEPAPVIAPSPPPPSPKPAAAAPAAVPMPAWDAGSKTTAAHEEEKKRSAALPVAIAAIVVLAIAGGGLFYMRSRQAAAPQPAQIAQAAPAPQPATTTTAPAVAAPVPTETIVPVPATTETIDPAKVNEEVQRRLAAERARLEEQMRAQQAAQAAAAPKPAPAQRVAAAPPPVRPQPQPQPQPQTAAPQPAVAENRPAPAQVQPQPQQAVSRPAQVAPAPAPQPAPLKEGDLVTDLDGLVPSHMVRRALVPYPPMAKLQRVEGTVLVSALISETGQVLETRVIKPINRNVGLNEAAEQIVRRSTFSPPMKNGVKVKAWTTVPIDFKL